MTGRTRRDAIRDWMILTFTLAVAVGVFAAGFASLRLLAVSGVFAAAAVVLAGAYSLADKP